MAVTSRTRNAVVRKGTWVRIPLSPFQERLSEYDFCFMRQPLFISYEIALVETKGDRNDRR